MLRQTAGGEIALEPNPPKDRYTCPTTGAHFNFKDIANRLEKVVKDRYNEGLKSGNQKINHSFAADQLKARQKGVKGEDADVASEPACDEKEAELFEIGANGQVQKR